MTSPDRPDPPDRIELRGLRVLGVHGVLPEERVTAQPFELDLDLEVELAVPGSSDDLADTVDYARVVDRASAVIAGDGKYHLLEALAEAVAVTGLDDHRVVSVTVGLRKLEPPMAAAIATVGVRITRRR
ncbi:MAG TPA: dihydroneopterin aldolase [Acidimicrobiales bacterium]|nr:dihydroneopterin aldolase [Acidimicrobiales bacterium]